MDDKNTQLILDTFKDTFKRYQEEVFKKLDEHSAILDEHSAILSEHSRILNQHSEKLNQHDVLFKEIIHELRCQHEKLCYHDEDLKEIKFQLSSIGRTVTRIDYEHDKKIQIGLEKLSMLIDKADNLQESLNRMDSKLEKHDIHIEVLEEKAL